MLVIIVLLLVVVELPQGILCFFVGIWGHDFAYRVYNPLGNLFELLTLVYSSINFLLYCTMSSQFSHAFRQLFIPHCCNSCIFRRSSLNTSGKDISAYTTIPIAMGTGNGTGNGTGIETGNGTGNETVNGTVNGALVLVRDPDHDSDLHFEEKILLKIEKIQKNYSREETEVVPED